jgi:hypothetical protein
VDDDEARTPGMVTKYEQIREWVHLSGRNLAAGLENHELRHRIELAPNGYGS